MQVAMNLFADMAKGLLKNKSGVNAINIATPAKQSMEEVNQRHKPIDPNNLPSEINSFLSKYVAQALQSQVMINPDIQSPRKSTTQPNSESKFNLKPIDAFADLNTVDGIKKQLLDDVNSLVTSSTNNTANSKSSSGSVYKPNLDSKALRTLADKDTQEIKDRNNKLKNQTAVVELKKLVATGSPPYFLSATNSKAPISQALIKLCENANKAYTQHLVERFAKLLLESFKTKAKDQKETKQKNDQITHETVLVELAKIAVAYCSRPKATDVKDHKRQSTVSASTVEVKDEFVGDRNAKVEERLLDEFIEDSIERSLTAINDPAERLHAVKMLAPYHRCQGIQLPNLMLDNSPELVQFLEICENRLDTIIAPTTNQPTLSRSGSLSRTPETISTRNNSHSDIDMLYKFIQAGDPAVGDMINMFLPFLKKIIRDSIKLEVMKYLFSKLEKKETKVQRNFTVAELIEVFDKVKDGYEFSIWYKEQVSIIVNKLIKFTSQDRNDKNDEYYFYEINKFMHSIKQVAEALAVVRGREDKSVFFRTKEIVAAALLKKIFAQMTIFLHGDEITHLLECVLNNNDLNSVYKLDLFCIYLFNTKRMTPNDFIATLKQFVKDKDFSQSLDTLVQNANLTRTESKENKITKETKTTTATSSIPTVEKRYGQSISVKTNTHTETTENKQDAKDNDSDNSDSEEEMTPDQIEAQEKAAAQAALEREEAKRELDKQNEKLQSIQSGLMASFGKRKQQGGATGLHLTSSAAVTLTTSSGVNNQQSSPNSSAIETKSNSVEIGFDDFSKLLKQMINENTRSELNDFKTKDKNNLIKIKPRYLKPDELKMRDNDTQLQRSIEKEATNELPSALLLMLSTNNLITKAEADAFNSLEIDALTKIFLIFQEFQKKDSANTKEKFLGYCAQVYRDHLKYKLNSLIAPPAPKRALSLHGSQSGVASSSAALQQRANKGNVVVTSGSVTVPSQQMQQPNPVKRTDSIARV